MNPAAIIRRVMADGVSLALSPAGTIKAAGKRRAVTRWLPVIRENKPGILTALQEAANEKNIFDRDAFNERAAIAEYDGGISRAKAEAMARLGIEATLDKVAMPPLRQPSSLKDKLARE